MTEIGANGAITSNQLFREIPAEELPRERMVALGPSTLNERELLAILLGSGSVGEHVLDLAKRVVDEFGNPAEFSRADYAELTNIKGIGKAKACQILAAFQLGKLAYTYQSEDYKISIGNPADVAELAAVKEMAFEKQELLNVVLLNTKNRVKAVKGVEANNRVPKKISVKDVSVKNVYVGNVSSSIARPSEIFRMAVRENCPHVIVVHNHPSGDPTPSDEDINVTRKLYEAGKLLDIKLLDHLIIGNFNEDGAVRYVSLKEKGLGFPAGA